MRVMVAGSEGSLMQATIPHLLAAGNSVAGVDNFFRYGKIERCRDYQFIEADLADRQVVRDVLRDHKIEMVIQAAARIFGVGGFHKYPADILSQDVLLHQNILSEGLAHGVLKIVYISSSMVYERATNVPTGEDDVRNMLIPFTDYGLSKLVGERLCAAFQRQYGLPYTVWRPFNILTPYEQGEEEQGISHVFADFIRKIVLEKRNPLEIIGDGEQVRCFTWIGDVAGAIAKYSFNPTTDNQVYNLGNPQPITMRELAHKIHAIAARLGAVPEEPALSFIHRRAYDDDVLVRIPSIEKAMRELKWSPRVLLDEALEICVSKVVMESQAAAR